jgi:hypothetical protein
MTSFRERMAAMWQDAANLVLGVWLLISPYILSYTDQAYAAWNAYAVGIIIAVIAAAAIWAYQKWEDWVSVVLGIWLIVSPWLLGFSTMAAPLWNQLVVGVLVGGFALWSAFNEHHTGGVASKA